jgi:nucleotide-binding universal stress UspA family protein
MNSAMTTSSAPLQTFAGAGTTAPRAGGPLLVATTGQQATAVITAARLLAVRLGREPYVIAVNELVPIYPEGVVAEPYPPSVFSERRRRLLDDVTRALRTAYDGDPSWPVEIVEGQPARVIADLARARHACMIVLGIGRHSPMDRIFGSETALQVIRLASRPVLAVAPTFARLPQRAVVAVDFSPASVRAAEEALALLGEGGTLTLVHVRPHDGDPRWLGDAALGATHGQRSAELFERLVAALDAPAQVVVEQVVLVGDPAAEVLAFAEREGADLIATGSSGLGFFDRLVVGSVTTRILRRSSVSLLVVPRPSAAEIERIERQLSGAVDSSDSARWPALLQAFSERNAGRPTQLEIDDPALGAQLQESGYLLLGASYDRRDDRLELMLGSPGAGAGHMTHTIGNVTSVAVLADPRQRDMALQARHGHGQTILTFAD